MIDPELLVHYQSQLIECRKAMESAVAPLQRGALGIPYQLAIRLIEEGASKGLPRSLLLEAFRK